MVHPIVYIGGTICFVLAMGVGIWSMHMDIVNAVKKADKKEKKKLRIIIYSLTSAFVLAIILGVIIGKFLNSLNS